MILNFASNDGKRLAIASAKDTKEAMDQKDLTEQVPRAKIIMKREGVYVDLPLISIKVLTPENRTMCVAMK